MWSVCLWYCAAGVRLALRVRDVGWLQGVKVPIAAVQDRISSMQGSQVSWAGTCDSLTDYVLLWIQE